MGNSVVSALFPEIFLDYIIFTMPLWFMIYLWGTPTLLIADAEGKQTLAKRLKAFLNPMFIGMIIGMIIGISGITLPSWITNVITSAGNCMSPLAMLLIGITVSAIDLKKAFTNVRIYIASILRLIIYPAIFLVVAHFVPMDQTIYLCAACAMSMPLGLSTVVIPAAYGRDTTDAASMCIISHMLSCITIPIIFWIIL
jgi:predicted permease